MSCRCQERRDAIRSAATTRRVGNLKRAAVFVAKTMAEDAASALHRKSKVEKR